MKKPIVLGSGKRRIFDEHKTYIEILKDKLAEMKSFFVKRNGNGKKFTKLTLNNIEEIYEHVIQVYYNGYRIKKVNDKWVYCENAPLKGKNVNDEVKFESNGNLSIRIQDGAHQKMLCFTIDSKMILRKN